MYHFSQAHPNIAALLKRVANTIASLGAIEVHDITFDPGDTLDVGNEPSMTVYYELPDDNGQPGQTRASRRPSQRSRAIKKDMP